MSAHCETCGRFVPTDTHSIMVHGPRCVEQHRREQQAVLERIGLTPQQAAERLDQYLRPRRQADKAPLS